MQTYLHPVLMTPVEVPVAGTLVIVIGNSIVSPLNESAPADTYPANCIETSSFVPMLETDTVPALHVAEFPSLDKVWVLIT